MAPIPATPGEASRFPGRARNVGCGRECMARISCPGRRHASGGADRAGNSKKSEEEPGGGGDREVVSYWQLLSYADRYDVVLMLVGSVAAMVSGLIFPAILVVQSHLINNFGSLQNRPVELARRVSEDATFLVYTAAVALVASYLEVSCWMKTGERQVARIRADYLRAILRQNVGYFDSDMSTAEVVGNVSVDTLLVQEAISEKVGNFIENLSHFVGGYFVGFTQIWRLALVMLPFFPLLIIPGSLYSKALSEFAIRRQSAYKEAGTIAEQGLSSVRTVYSFVAEKKTTEKYSAALDGTVKLGLKQGLAKGLAMGSSGINFALWAFMAWYGSELVMQHRANGGQVLTTGFAVLSGGIALGNATPNMKAFAEGRVAGTRIFKMIQRVPPIDTNDSSGKTLSKVEGNLDLKEVEFAYPSRPGALVLKSFTLHVPAKKTVALVGSSGSGKSTIISLIERFYDPVAGQVMLDNVDIRELHLMWLRRQMGLVNQEPGLFATSIRENILYGKENASMEEITHAAKLANAHDFIQRMPRGYDTQVGERGVQLSGGQKQRIAIARALIRNPPILLLDEATSALDSLSEQAVQQALERARMERTTVIVAHRLSTVQEADLIVVMDSGIAVESGSHEELVAEKTGVYASLLMKQANSSGHYEINPATEQVMKVSSATEGDLVDVELSATSEKDINRYTRLPSRTSRKVKSKPKVKKPSVARLLALNKPEWKQGLLGLWGAVSFGFVHPFYAFLLGSMVASYYTTDVEKLHQTVRIHVYAFLGLGVASFIVNIVQHCSFAALGESLTKRVREKLLASMLSFEVGWFDREENSTGALCSRLASDASMVRGLVGDRISLLVQTASATSVSFIVGLITSWKLAMVIIAIQPLIILCYYVKNICLRGFAQNTAAAQREACKIASEAVSHHRTVTAFSSQERVLAFFKSKLEVPIRETMKRSHIAGFSLGVAQFILYASWGLDFWYGGLLVKHGESTFGAVLKTIFILVSTGRVLAEAGTLSPDLAKGVSAVKSVFEILDRKTEIDAEKDSAKCVPVLKGDVEFYDVYFAYPSRPDLLVLKNFRLRVNAGQTVALVGESGCGKSSAIGLIERFYDPIGGKVTIDGRDIRGLSLKWLRRQIALVSQEPTLFATSIWENIAYGTENASDSEVVEAARAANAHSFISALPDGYSTFAGEKGLQLSGGQKQRIAIARAILKNPAILLLDEATSALDAESEEIVQQALETIMASRTTIVVAHRLSTIQNADSIAVVQDGSVVEQGSHEDLLQWQGMEEEGEDENEEATMAATNTIAKKRKTNKGVYFSLIHRQYFAGRASLQKDS
ncbi:putative multidrug resistance protein [Selaginella moellendorffii]|nr:putative multidrug resistance protein [Selaginella moellendorffii]|eukprot:XP_002983357.2 putative multidrug resistance protein [Selaginella moellendorffii]